MLELLLQVGVMRGKNAIVLLTADSTDFTDEVAGKATHEALTDAATLRCSAKPLCRQQH